MSAPAPLSEPPAASNTPDAAATPAPTRASGRGQPRIQHWIAIVWRTFSWNQRLQFLTILFGLPLAYFIATRNIEPSFAVTATTEYLTFKIVPGHQPRWHLSEVTVIVGPQPIDSQRLFTGSVVPSAGSEVTIGRVSQGAVFLAIEGGRQSSGQLFDQSGIRVAQLGTTTVFRWDSVGPRATRGRTITFSLDEGVLLQKLGEPVTYQSGVTPLLRSGKISLLKRSWKILGGDIGEIGWETLQMGDQLTFNPAAPATGFVSADERVALNASIRVVSDKARITPAGGAHRDVAATIYDYFRNDRAFQLVFVIFGLLYGLLKILGSSEQGKKSEPGPPQEEQLALPLTERENVNRPGDGGGFIT